MRRDHDSTGNLEKRVGRIVAKLHDKEFWVDTLSGGLYSLVIGSAIDYSAGLEWDGVIVSRSFAAVANTLTDGLYGKWRNTVFHHTKTTEENGNLRQATANFLAFNTFQTPLYAGIVGVSSLLSDGQVDPEKMLDGAVYLAGISPFIGPTMGWWMDAARTYFGLPTAPQKASNPISNI